MLRKGTRVKVVEAWKAREMGAMVEVGDTGTVTGQHVSDYSVEVRLDDTSRCPEVPYIPVSCLKRIRKQRMR